MGSKTGPYIIRLRVQGLTVICAGLGLIGSPIAAKLFRCSLVRVKPNSATQQGKFVVMFFFACHGSL